jgi:dienelactone hydrolase
MAEIVLFHHALGLTPGVIEFADGWRAAGHVVHTPDLYEGRTFVDLDEAVEFADGQGVETWIAAASAAAAAHPDATVFAGFSLGSMCAQYCAQTRPGVRAALLFHGAMSLETMELAWPEGVALQVHSSEADPWVELDQAQELIESVDGSELYLYPGSSHLFADPRWGDYVPESAQLLNERALAGIARL